MKTLRVRVRVRVRVRIKVRVRVKIRVRAEGPGTGTKTLRVRVKIRIKTYTPELKKQRMSEETNVLAQEDLSKRQKTKGQSGCKQLACSTHKG